MKQHKLVIDPSLHRSMLHKDKLYGTTTMGARGQLVVPAAARKDLALKPGDQLVVIGKFGKALGLIKSDELGELVNIVMEHLAGSGMERQVKKHMQKLLASLAINYKKDN